MTKWDRLSYALRRDGVSSTITAAALVGFIAGLLDASGHIQPLLAYLCGWLALTIVVLFLRRRWVRVRLLLMALRRWHRSDRKDAAPQDAAADPVLFDDTLTPVITRVITLTSTPDPFYFGTFRSLLHPELSPIVVTPCAPRDVSRPENLLHPVVVREWDGVPVAARLGPNGAEIRFIRQLPRAPDDKDHAFASRDVCYLGELGAELLALGATRQPLCMPEHCVDTELLAHHDVVVLSGPDTNFWHAALFEAVASGFERPASTVPLALGLRDVTAKGTPIYGSSDLFVHLRGAAEAIGISGGPDAARLAEASRPTYGMILATTNPLSDPADPHWCVFLAGLRSLGTMAATLCFTSLLRALTSDDQRDFWSLAPATDLPGSYARVAAALVRADVVEAAAGPGEDRVARQVPHDRPDPLYRDSYVVTTAEILDTTSQAPAWRPVDLTAFAPSPDAEPVAVPTVSTVSTVSTGQEATTSSAIDAG